MLQQYVTDTRDLLNDSDGQFFDEAKIIRYVNRSRRRIAYASGCVRVMPPGTKTHRLQEVYKFSEWISSVQGVLPGAQSILSVRSLSVAIGVGGWKPTWKRLPFTAFQARFRMLNGTWFGTVSEPGYYAQYGQGSSGSIYLAPIPSQDNPMELDLSVIPMPLQTDHDPEPIPQPWQDAVPWWAATMCLIQQQRPQDAQQMALLFNLELPFCASVVCPTMIQNPYGATLRSA
jgi:hypothetical protein